MQSSLSCWKLASKTEWDSVIYVTAATIKHMWVFEKLSVSTSSVTYCSAVFSHAWTTPVCLCVREREREGQIE